MRHITKSLLAAAFVTSTILGGLAAGSAHSVSAGRGTVVVTPDTGWPDP